MLTLGDLEKVKNSGTTNGTTLCRMVEEIERLWLIEQAVVGYRDSFAYSFNDSTKELIVIMLQQVLLGVGPRGPEVLNYASLHTGDLHVGELNERKLV